MKRHTVLVIDDDPSARSLLYTFLASMQCERVAVSCDKALAEIERQEFDAVLLDLRPAGVPAEQLLQGIKNLRPALLSNVLAITDETPNSHLTDLIGEYGLIRVTSEGLLRKLWDNLQSLFTSRPGKVPLPQERRIGELVFDTFRQPLPAGLRASAPSARRLVYRCDSIVVDVLIEPRPVQGQLEITGQVLSAVTWQGKNADLPVALTTAERKLLASATTNQFGEFSLAFEFAENLILKVRVAENSWVFIYLANMGWARNAMSSSVPSN